MRYRFGTRLVAGSTGLALGLLTVGAYATTVDAGRTLGPQVTLGVRPDLQTYNCPSQGFEKRWDLSFSGGNGTYTWEVSWGDGLTRTVTTSNNTDTARHEFTRLGADGCRDFTQSWNVSSPGGGSASETTRVVWTR